MGLVPAVRVGRRKRMVGKIGWCICSVENWDRMIVRGAEDGAYYEGPLMSGRSY